METRQIRSVHKNRNAVLLFTLKGIFFFPNAAKCILRGGNLIVGFLSNIVVFTLQYEAP